MENIVFLGGLGLVFICASLLGNAFENGKQQGFRQGYAEGFEHGQHEVFNDFKKGLNKVSKQN